MISKSESSLKIKADNNKIAEITLTQNNVKESGERTGFFTLTCDTKQTLAELKADPRKYYVAVKGVENGTLEIIKTSEDGIYQIYRLLLRVMEKPTMSKRISTVK